LIKNGRVIN